MSNNLEKFKSDILRLQKKGQQLSLAMALECYPEKAVQIIEAVWKAKEKGKVDSSRKMGVEDSLKAMKELPNFTRDYQSWYSEALALIRTVLPDRFTDFQKHYASTRNRKEITFENYKIEDYLKGLTVRNSYTQETIVDKSAAMPDFTQQCSILDAAAMRFETSLFEIRQLVQADLFDSEIETAEHLAKSKFTRAAGAVAGVVLEGHLKEVCSNHSIKIPVKNPTISTFNDALKAMGAIDVPQWRFIQHLGDIRNLCDHAKAPEPTSAQIDDLISGVRKTIKTVY